MGRLETRRYLGPRKEQLCAMAWHSLLARFGAARPVGPPGASRGQPP